MVVEREVVVQTQPDDSGHKAQMTLRARLMAQLNGPLEALDTARGLVVTVPDSDFRETALTASTTSSLAHVAATVMSQPGLTIEIDGNSDSAEPSAERIALERAAAVKDALILAGCNRIGSPPVASATPGRSVPTPAITAALKSSSTAIPSATRPPGTSPIR